MVVLRNHHTLFAETMRTTTDYTKLKDIFEYSRSTYRRVPDKALALANELFDYLMELVARVTHTDPREAVRYHELAKDVCLFLSPHIFDRYCLYMEWDREPAKRFYLPRREVLKIVADDLQNLYDRKIVFLSVSTPPRIGKSTLGCFFMSWLMGKHPNLANLMSGHSDKLTKGFFKEVFSLITDTQYLWADVFPTVALVGTSAEDEAIHLDSIRRFPTLTCRSIGGTLTGAVEVGLCLYCDDMIEDLEESINPARLQTKYDAYLNQLKDRMKENTIQVMIGTRWSPADVQGRIQAQYRDDPKYRFRNIPALNDAGESNFDYPYGLGFSTAYYLDMKASIDPVTWSAKYMGNPAPREGLLYPEDELTMYNGVLPDGEPIIYAPADVAWGGGDYFSMPFLYEYGDGSVYVHDAIYNNGDKSVTKPRVIAKIIELSPDFVQFEANNGGDEYADDVDRQLKEMGIRPHITSRRAPTTTGKLVRMLNGATEARRWIFRDRQHRSKEYADFMLHLTQFNQMGIGKQPDDAPDSLAQGERMMHHGIARVEAFRRPF